MYNLLLIFFSFALSPFLIAVRPPGSILIGFEFFLFFFFKLTSAKGNKGPTHTRDP